MSLSAGAVEVVEAPTTAYSVPVARWPCDPGLSLPASCWWVDRIACACAWCLHLAGHEGVTSRATTDASRSLEDRRPGGACVYTLTVCLCVRQYTNRLLCV